MGDIGIKKGSFDWTDAACDLLRRLVAAQVPYSQIGAALGVTRNAAIGKALRLGLANPRQKKRKTRNPKRPLGHDAGIASSLTARRRIIKNQIMDVEEPTMQQHVQDLHDLDIPEQQRVTSVMGLTDATCRWPVGTPGRPGFFFCGATPVEGFAYCGPHCARAFAGVPDGARRRPFIARRHAA